MDTNIPVYDDLYDVWYHPWWQQTWFVVTALIIGVLILSACVWFLWKRFRPQRPQTPLERIQVRLVKLRDRIVRRAISPKEFYHELTHELKVYLSVQCAKDVIDKTDYELIEALKGTSFPAASLHDLKEVLNGAVLIKFAQHERAEKQLLHDLDWCEKQVQVMAQAADKHMGVL